MLLLLYSVFYILVRIFVFAKVFFLLCVTYYYPESYPTSTLTWWMYFLIFDIWLLAILPNKTPNKENEIKQ
jgi:hypothetical protein